ncbi:sulfate permease [Ameyamaea chiangmaiensis NBRC 103196]|uniref:SulP family inorganic anion transporter n=1 Tax=Ameyamaea chiangmaiensis TaxID=442969 RepID=A0A850PJ46_9PROT|nr:SulP family inorganic anion transporter [Ameyamaea chiangmaiensis]MBS4074097.1 SulP family inorganic anion transporter [Ameyamaea chiangmaiensis]NVN41301.1 SulP family inorganic anion transporter [Ameyamaea chiangmaiensis]GBQ67251.1 sulfate permease [Ameyamaea chiangmaiensis NBRC 103196]
MPEPNTPSPTSWWRDTLAGLTQASMTLPQVLGYTRIAHTPAAAGLYTLILPLLGFAAFGSSRHLVVAADSATAAIFSGALAPMAPPGSAHYLALVGATALMTAAFLLVARLARLGFLADFMAETVLAGFLTGVGVQVSVGMLHDMLGLESHTTNALRQIGELATTLRSTHGLDAGIAALVVAGVFVGRARWPRAPVPLAIVIASIGASAAFGLDSRGVATLGAVPGGLPRLGWPDIGWNEMLALAPVAASCVFVIIAQSAATARAFAGRFGEQVDEDADIFGLGVANALAGVSGAFVVNGSPTATALSVQSGARSQRAQVVVAIVTGLVLLFATGPLRDLPRCVLAALVFTVAIDMIAWRTLRAIRAESPGEWRLALATAATVVAVGVQQGIFLAITLSLFRHVRHSYRPHTMVLQPSTAEHGLEAVPCRPGLETEPGMIVYRFGADLFYANAARFTGDVSALVARAPHRVRCVIVDAGAITDIDYAAAHALRALIAPLQASGVTVLFGRVSGYLRADMRRHELTDVVGEAHLFDELHVALAAARALRDVSSGAPSPPPAAE